MTNEELFNLFKPALDELNNGINWLIECRPLLAHYTSIEVLENILRDHEVWLSNPLFMNDLEEMKFGLLEGRKAFQESQTIKKLCGSDGRYKTLIDAFNYLFNQFETEHAFDVYVFCLSEHPPENDDGLLSMWRAYGAQGSGAALVF